MTERHDLLGRFNDAAMRATQAQGGHRQRDKYYELMANAHAGAMEFLRRMQEEWQPVIDGYNANARSSSIQSTIACRANPGGFLEDANECSPDKSAPHLAVQDLANGKEVARFALHRIPPEDEPELESSNARQLGMRQRALGYQLPGAELKLTSIALPPGTDKYIRKLTEVCVKRLEEYLECREHI